MAYQLIKKIFGGSWDAEDLIMGLLFINLGWTFALQKYTSSQIIALQKHTSSQIIALQKDTSSQIIDLNSQITNTEKHILSKISNIEKQISSHRGEHKGYNKYKKRKN